jgi:Transposase DDE domain
MKMGNTSLLKNFTSVYIQDSTHIKLPAFLQHIYPGFSNQCGGSAGASIQFVYDLKGSEINHISLTNALANDSLQAANVSWLKPNSLLIRDLGYFSNNGLKEIENKGSYYLSRLKPKTVLYEKKGEEFRRIDIEKLLHHMKKNKLSCIEKNLYVSSTDKIPARVCFSLIPDHIREERMRKNKIKNKGKGYSCTKEFSVWSAFNIFITNVKSDELSIESIFGLYRLRWQIELVFKTWKSYYRIDKIKKMKRERIECYIYASLLYVLIHWKIVSMCLTNEQDSDYIISQQKFAKLMLMCREKIRMIAIDVKNNFEHLCKLLQKVDRILVQKEQRKGKVSSVKLMKI